MSNISDVREHLLNTLADLRDKKNPMEVDRARAVAEVAKVIVETAKVEVEYIRTVSADSSSFLEPKAGALPPGVTRHRIR